MDRFIKIHTKALIAGFLILLSALFFRTYKLGIIPVFADEAIYIRWAQVMRAESGLRFIPLSDGKQPLFMWVVIPFLKLISDPLIAGRLVSAGAGIATIIGVFILTYLLFRKIRISLIAAMFLALSPFSIFFDRLALADSMLSMFGVWTFIFIYLTVRKLRLDTAMLAGFSLGGALLTKSPAIYFALISPLVFLFSEWPKRIKEKIYKLSIYVFLFSFTGAISFGLYNILRLGPEFHMIAIRNKDYIYPLSHIFDSPLDPFMPFLNRIVQYFYILGPSVLLVIFVYAVLTGLLKNLKTTLLLLSWTLLPIYASAMFSKTMTARYVYFSVPYFIVMSSFAFLQVKNKYIGYFLISLFLIQSLLWSYNLLTDPSNLNLPRSERSGYLEEWTSGYGIRETSEFLKTEKLNNPGTKFIVGTEGYFGTLPDGLQIYMNNDPEIVVVGVGQPVRNVPVSLLESRKAGNRTFLLVNDTRLLGEPSKLGFELLKEFPKAVKPDGAREKLLLLELKKI